MKPFYENKFGISLYCGDCLEVLPQIGVDNFDCVIADPPYGNGKTACKWDELIPTEKLWPIVWNSVRPDGAVYLFSNEPFTSQLICSQMDEFRYRWNWKKESGGNFQNAHVQPLSIVEDICVFSKGRCANGAKNAMRYFPVLEEREEPLFVKGGPPVSSDMLNKTNMVNQCKTYSHKYPTTVLEFNKPFGKTRLHPTQKPVELIEYLLNTYTLEGEMVLDFSAGSGTTAEACMRTKRKCVLIEKENSWCEVIADRLSKVESEIDSMLFF